MEIKKNEAGLFETTIDEARYEFEKWGAEEALDTLLDLSTLMGRPMGAIAAAGGLKADVGAPTIESIVTALTENIRGNRPMVMDLFKKLTSSRKVLCEGKEIRSFNAQYSDRLGHMFQVARANLTVQYANFFSEVKALLGPSLQGKTLAAEQAPTASTA